MIVSVKEMEEDGKGKSQAGSACLTIIVVGKSLFIWTKNAVMLFIINK